VGVWDKETKEQRRFTSLVSPNWCLVVSVSAVLYLVASVVGYNGRLCCHVVVAGVDHIAGMGKATVVVGVTVHMKPATI